MSNLLADLRVVMQQLNQRPIVWAIWFVDQPHLRYSLEARLHQAAPDLFKTSLPWGASLGPHIAGIPVREWSSSCATDDEWRKWPWIILWPGVWLEMSDGIFHKMDERIPVER